MLTLLRLDGRMKGNEYLREQFVETLCLLCSCLTGVTLEMPPTDLFNVILNCWQHTVGFEKH